MCDKYLFCYDHLMKKTILILSLLVSSFVHATPFTIESPKIGSIEVAYSPEGGGQELILKLIRSARVDIQLMAYTFTSKAVTEALIKAHRRGVRVSVAADIENTKSKNGQMAMSVLVKAGIPVRTVTKYRAMMNDKMLIVDGKHVEAGAFNFSKLSADAPQPENVTVYWDAPEVADVYFGHWQNRWRRGKAFALTN